MFSTEHLLWIGLCAAFVALLTFLSKRMNFSLKCAGSIMTVICAISETSKIMGNMAESTKGGAFLSPTSLPLHLCSLMLFGVLYITFGKDGAHKQTMIDFLAVAGILGSLCSIFFPTVGTDFMRWQTYRCFLYHAGLLWFGLYLIVCGKAKLGRKAFGRNMRILCLLVWAMMYVNSALSAYDTNFMFLVRPAMKNLPFLNLEHGWYVYFAHLVSMGVVVSSLFHLPFMLAERKKAKTNV